MARFVIGDPLPPLKLLDRDGRPAELITQENAGRAFALFLGRPPDLAAIAARLDDFAAVDARPFAIALDGAAPAHAPVPLFRCAEDAPPGAVVLDANLRVVATFSGDDTVGAALVCCRALFEGDPAAPAPAHAPVLVVPRIFDAELCARLIELWQQGDKRANETSLGVAGTADYRARSDSDVKRRADVLIPEGDNEVNLAIRRCFQRRVVPELAKGFQFQVRAYEVARVGCYDAATGGYFRRHRDDVGDPAKPRRFALSVNLSDDYDGGGLWFPEYGRRRYRPAAGDGVVFSCRLLHEALPVTRGRRFGLFTFFR